MKITDKHVSDCAINTLISFYTNPIVPDDNINKVTVMALLELKQRRAEDRMAEGHEQGL